jgi:HlyD family secretion protein
MDQTNKKRVKRKISKSALITIIILLVVLLGILVYGYFYYQKTTALILEKQQKATELEPDTTKVERGELTNTLDDISGVVRSNQSVYLYWQTSGTVSNVYVEVGDEVKKGDVLAEFDRSTIDSSIINAEVTKEKAEEKLDRLFTSTLSLEQARTKMVEAKKAVEDAQKNVDALGIVRADYIELGVKYDDYQRSITAYEEAKKYFDSVKMLDLDNVTRISALSRLESAKSQMDSAKAQYNWYNGEAEEIEVQKADAALRLAQAQLDDAVRAYNRIKDGPTDNQVRSIQAEADSAAATVNTAKIIAPINGTVAQVDAKPYDVIAYETTSAARDKLAVRIDDLSSHYIDISVTELDINNIHLGQQVTITFDAIPLREYKGNVVNISNAGVVDNLSVNFDLTVKMEETDDNSIKSGMMADVAIVTEQVTDALYVSRQAVTVAEDGLTRIVKKLMADGTYEDIPVTVGMSSGSNVQVISDRLNEGDVVKLNKITSAMNNDFGIGSMFGNMRGPAMGPAMGGGAPGGRGRR